MPAIKITSSMGLAKLFVDGVELRNLTGIAVSLQSGEVYEVTVTMATQPCDIDIDSSVLKIAGMDMPDSLELALLEFLRSKHLGDAPAP